MSIHRFKTPCYFTQGCCVRTEAACVQGSQVCMVRSVPSFQKADRDSSCVRTDEPMERQYWIHWWTVHGAKVLNHEEHRVTTELLRHQSFMEKKFALREVKSKSRETDSEWARIFREVMHQVHTRESSPGSQRWNISWETQLESKSNEGAVPLVAAPLMRYEKRSDLPVWCSKIWWKIAKIKSTPVISRKIVGSRTRARRCTGQGVFITCGHVWQRWVSDVRRRTEVFTHMHRADAPALGVHLA